MTIDYREIIEAISELVNNENIRITMSKSLEGGLICGACSLIGGLLLGPRGLAIGGAAGSVLAYGMTKDSFRSLGDVIRNDLNESQKKRLAQRVTNAVKSAHINDLQQFLVLLTSANAKQIALNEITNFVSRELNVNIID